jgi:hypothetical protein
MVNATENGKLCMIGDCAASMNTGILKSQWIIASEIGNDKQINASNSRSEVRYSIDETVDINTRMILYLLKNKYVIR